MYLLKFTHIARNTAIVWLVGGCLLFLVDGGPQHLYSMPGIIFLGAGTIAAVIILGGISYLGIKLVAKRLYARFPNPSEMAQLTQHNIYVVGNATFVIMVLLFVYMNFFRG